MRVAYIGVAHWHTGLYLEPLLGNADVEIVGVADPSSPAAEDWAAKAGTRAFTSYQEMCERLQPDLVFALGRPVDMAATAEYLIQAGIPFAMEKPCGVTVAEIEYLARLAQDQRAFVSLPFTTRYSRMMKLIGEMSSGQDLVYATFKLYAGVPQRYRDSGVGWNLVPELAGGGCTLNLGVHYFDLLRLLAPSEPWHVAAASMSSQLSNVAVEDFSTVLLESEGRRAVVQTGYVYPGPGLDHSFSIVLGDHYFRCEGTNRLVVSRAEVVRAAGRPKNSSGSGDNIDRSALAEIANVGQEMAYEMDTTVVSYYNDFVLDTVRRVRADQSPLANLDDMVEAAKLVAQAYRLTNYAECLK